MPTCAAVLDVFAQILEHLYGWSVEDFARRDLFDEVDEDKLTNLTHELDETFFLDGAAPAWPYSGSGHDLMKVLTDHAERVTIRFLDASGRWVPPWDRRAGSE